MKKIILYSTLSILLLVCWQGCKNQPHHDEQDHVARSFHYVPKEKFYEIAAKYGFSEPLNEENKIFLNTVTKNNPFDSVRLKPYILQRANEELIEIQFKSYREYITIDKINKAEIAAFNKGKINVKSKKDYYDLINSLPRMRAAEVEAHGGEMQYRKYVDSQSRMTVRVYLVGKDSILNFVHKYDDGKYYPPKDGFRIDNLKD